MPTAHSLAEFFSDPLRFTELNIIPVAHQLPEKQELLPPSRPLSSAPSPDTFKLPPSRIETPLPSRSSSPTKKHLPGSLSRQSSNPVTQSQPPAEEVSVFIKKSILQTLRLEKICLNLVEENLLSFFIGMQENRYPNLKEIDLSQNHFSYETFKNLMVLLAQNPSITKVDLSYCKFDESSTSIPQEEEISFPDKLTGPMQLKLAHSKLSSGLIKLINFLLSKQVLEELDLSSSFSRSAIFQHLMPALKLNTSIKSLLLADNFLWPAALFSESFSMNIAETFPKNISYLNLTNTQLFRLNAITAILPATPFLVQLDLSDNLFEEQDLEQFMRVLRNTSVKYLNLSNNGIGLFGIKCIAELLKSNHGLEYLNLQGNFITTEGVKCLIRALKKNTHLKLLNLEFCLISHEGIELLSDYIKTVPPCVKIRLREYSKTIHRIQIKMGNQSPLPSPEAANAFIEQERKGLKLTASIPSSPTDGQNSSITLYKN